MQPINNESLPHNFNQIHRCSQSGVTGSIVTSETCNLSDTKIMMPRYRSGSHVLFYIYSRACYFFAFLSSHCFVVPSIQLTGRILVFYVQFLWKD